MSKELKIKRVSNSNDFVGIKINNNEVELHVPEVFRNDNNRKLDILLLLDSLSLSKKPRFESFKKGIITFEKIWPISSYLWIIQDYLENGFYYNKEIKFSQSNCGKISWKKALKQSPILSDGNIIYDKLITSKTRSSNDIISHTYKLCLKQSTERIGWLFDNTFQFEVQQIYSIPEMINSINSELNQTFDDIKKIRYKHLLKILNNTEGSNIISNKCFYGIYNYYYVFETMIDNMFGGISEIKEKNYNPEGKWHLNQEEETTASQLRPDTIIIKDHKTYILDAKMYKYGYTHNPSDLPSTQSIQKQITYGDFVHKSLNDKFVRNAFILAYNKELDSFKNNSVINVSNNDLVYIGYADANWRENKRENKEDYDSIYTFCIDFNYLLRNYKSTNTKMINELCKSIEDNIKLIKQKGD